MKVHKKSGQSMASNDTKIALLEQSIAHINESLLRIEKRFDTVDRKFELIDKKFELLDRRFELTDKKFDALEIKMANGFRDINNRIWYQFYWMIGGFVSILGLISHALDWI